MKRSIISLLNEDLEGEHAAIIQYLSHAYSMGEGEFACEIEAIAREEMRHFDLLSQMIVSLGGIPSLERGQMRTPAGSVSDWMKNDVLQEDVGIFLYEKHIESIKDPRINRLLTRILSDEKAHRDAFQHMVEKVKKKGIKDVRGSRVDDFIKTLNWGIDHEYSVILQYLIHRYLTPYEFVQKEMEDQAINEMQHLGWLAETVVDNGGIPDIEHSSVDQSRNTVNMLKADIKVEQEVAREYDRFATKIEDPGIKALIMRIRDHEIYHADIFTDLLNKVEEEL